MGVRQEWGGIESRFPIPAATGAIVSAERIGMRAAGESP